MTAAIQSPLLTTREAAAYLRMSVRSFWRAVNRHKIKATTLGKQKRLWRRDVLDRAIDDQTRRVS